MASTRQAWRFLPDPLICRFIRQFAALHQKLSGFTFTGNQDMDYENTFRHQGYGLENTILRFHIYYRGEEYFHVSRNDSDNLTTVTIGGPLKPEKLFSRSTS